MSTPDFTSTPEKERIPWAVSGDHPTETQQDLALPYLKRVL